VSPILVIAEGLLDIATVGSDVEEERMSRQLSSTNSMGRPEVCDVAPPPWGRAGRHPDPADGRVPHDLSIGQAAPSSAVPVVLPGVPPRASGVIAEVGSDVTTVAVR